MPKPIVVVGSLNIDLVLSLPRIPAAGETLSANSLELFCGGKGANQAAAAARLGARTFLIGRTGRDSYADRLRHELSASGVFLDAVQPAAAPTGTAIILREPHGENRIIITAGANAEHAPADIEASRDLIASAGIILTQLETRMDTLDCLARLAAQLSVPVMLDPAPFQPIPSAVLNRIAWLTPNQTEARALSPRSPGHCDNATESDLQALADALLALGPANILLKRGAQGAYIVTALGERALIPPRPPRAIDTTGAGDCFNAAFATALVRGDSWQSAARFATAAASLSVARPGAMASFPTLEELTVTE
jgi:ribokinase